MANTRNRITNIQGQITDLEQRIAILKTIQTQRDEARNLKDEIYGFKQQAETLFAEIQQNKENSSLLEGSIQELVSDTEESKKTFDEHSGKLKRIEEKIQKFEVEITEQLNCAASGALAIAFSTRQGKVEKELKMWRKILFGVTGALMSLAIGFLVYSFKVNVDTLFFLKLSVSLPFIFAVWFASRQYTKERFIVERYAFKAAQAESLSAFSKTVKEMSDTKEGRAETQKFVISSVDKIYTAPKLNDDDEGGLILEKALKLAKNIAEIK